MTKQLPIAPRISLERISSFLTSHGVRVYDIERLPSVGSQNFHARTQEGEFVVCCDPRRSLDEVRVDQEYIRAVQSQDVPVFTNGWKFGYINDIATTVRPYFRGSTIADTRHCVASACSLAGRVLARVHGVPLDGLPVRVPFYSFLINVESARFDLYLKYRCHLSEDELVVCDSAYERLTSHTPLDISGTNTRQLIHGDFTPRNVLVDDEENILVIDWEKTAIGPSILDVAQSLFHFCMPIQGDTFTARTSAFIAAYLEQTDVPAYTFDELVRWIATFADAFIVTDATLACQNRDRKTNFSGGREDYFVKYCMPLHLRYLERVSQLCEIVRKAFKHVETR